jgi:hypothetical protein
MDFNEYIFPFQHKKKNKLWLVKGFYNWFDFLFFIWLDGVLELKTTLLTFLRFSWGIFMLKYV